MTALAHSVDALRALMGALMEELSALRQDAMGGVALLRDRMGRLEFRAPGSEPLATVDDLDAYRQASAAGSGRDAAARIAWCESNITALATIVANPRAVVGLQSSMARRAGVPGAAPPSSGVAPPRADSDPA